MEIIRIFLASSIIEFAELRRELKVFQQEFNQTELVERGFYLNLQECETQSKHIELKGKQNSYDNLARNADLFLLVCSSNTIGQFTFEEFEAAAKAQSEKGTPEIKVFKQTSGKPVRPSVKVLSEKAQVHGAQIHISAFETADEAKQMIRRWVLAFIEAC